jgi:hypothetical protein
MAVSRHSFVVRRLLKSALKARNNPDQNDFFDTFCDTLHTLGGVYVKFLQGLMLDRTLKSKNKNVLDIFENNVFAPVDPHKVLESQLGAEKASRILLLSHEPIAAGSYSAVYEGYFAGTKEKVAVKILRPHIKRELRSDLDFLRVLASVYKLAEPKNMILDISRVYGQFRKSCFEEIDFASEIACMEYLDDIYKDHPTIVIPKVFVDYSTKEVIIQQWIDGVSLTDALQAKIDGFPPGQYVKDVTGSDLPALLTVLGEELLYGSFAYRYIHGDPHPGNIRILPGNKIALIDFGLRGKPFPVHMAQAQLMVWQNDIDVHRGIFEPVAILKAFFSAHQHGLYRAFESLSHYTGGSVDDVIKEMVEFIKFDPSSATDELKKKWTDYASGAQVIKDCIKNFKDLGIVASVHSLGAQRSHHTISHLISALGYKVQIWPTILENVITRVHTTKPELFQPERKLVLDQALEYLYAWSEKVSQTNSDFATVIQQALMTPTKNLPTKV